MDTFYLEKFEFRRWTDEKKKKKNLKTESPLSMYLKMYKIGIFEILWENDSKNENEIWSFLVYRESIHRTINAVVHMLLQLWMIISKLLLWG